MKKERQKFVLLVLSFYYSFIPIQGWLKIWIYPNLFFQKNFIINRKFPEMRWTCLWLEEECFFMLTLCILWRISVKYFSRNSVIWGLVPYQRISTKIFNELNNENLIQVGKMHFIDFHTSKMPVCRQVGKLLGTETIKISVKE